MGGCISVLKEHTDLVQSTAWSQDGSGLTSSANDNTIKIWDLELNICSSTPEELSETREQHRNSVTSIRISFRGRNNQDLLPCNWTVHTNALGTSWYGYVNCLVPGWKWTHIKISG
jgi:WD40 repeat protein